MHEISDKQRQYLEKVRDFAIGKEIVIYGAGTTGRQLFRLLERNHMRASAYCVTDTDSNPTIIDDVPVYSLTDIIASKDREVAVLLAALPPTNRSMIEQLQSHGVQEYLDIEKDMRHILDEVCQRPTLEITSRIGCSVRCRFCPQDVLLSTYDLKKRDVLLRFETFKTCLDKTPKNLIVDFAGYAEPFLNPEILSMMRYAVDSGRDVRLYTTLVGMTEDIFREVLILPFYSVVLHLPDCHNYSNIPLTKEYYDFLQRILSAKKSDGTPFVDKANGQAAPHPSVLHYIQQHVTVHQVLVDWAGNLKADELGTTGFKGGKLICEYAVHQDHNVLLPDGTVVLCCMDWKNTGVLGNLVKDSYEEISHGLRKMAILREMSQECGDRNFICRNCTNAIQM